MKGEALEAFWSKKYHSMYQSLLVSDKSLRSRNLGQIDIAFFAKNQLVVLEVKSSGTIKQRQLQRLEKSSRFLSGLFKRGVALYITKSRTAVKKFCQF